MGRELGKRTAPGFGDPNAPETLSRPADGDGREAQPIISIEPDAAPQQRVSVSRLAPTPLVSMPAGPAEALGQGLPMAPDTPGSQPMVEVEVRYEHGPAPTSLPERRVIEIWTQNSVYALDTRMRCIAVRAPSSEAPIDDHPFVGTRLVGGQWQSEDGVELSYPLPRPGSCAVFEGQRGNKRRFSRTSAVERVVLRLQVFAVTGSGRMPSWAELVEE